MQNTIMSCTCCCNNNTKTNNTVMRKLTNMRHNARIKLQVLLFVSSSACMYDDVLKILYACTFNFQDTHNNNNNNNNNNTIKPHHLSSARSFSSFYQLNSQEDQLKNNIILFLIQVVKSKSI